MARQTGDIKIRGTVEGLCFYRMQGRYFVRRKSSLSGKQFRKDNVFAGSRKSAGLLAEASPLASRLYHRLPKEQKKKGVFQTLAGRVKLLLQEGRTKAQVEHWFEQSWLQAVEQAPLPATLNRQGPAKARSSLKQRTAVRRLLPTLFLFPAPLQCKSKRPQPRYSLRE